MNRHLWKSSAVATLPVLLALLGCALADVQTNKPANPAATSTLPKHSSVSVHQVEQTWTLSDHYIGPATATCPPGEFALGGGWSVTPAVGVQVVTAGVSGNTWSVLMISQASYNQVTAYVECLSGAAGAVVTQRTVDFGVPQSASTVEALPAPTLTCNAGEVPVGFGFDISSDSRYLNFVEAYPFVALGVPFWVIKMSNHTILTSYMRASVECLSNVTAPLPLPDHPGNVRPVAVSYTVLYSPSPDALGPEIPAGQKATVQQDCPSGTAVVGGGVFYKSFGNSLTEVGVLDYQRATPTGWQGEVLTESAHVYPHVAAECLSFG
jgi:hypothetical protein